MRDGSDAVADWPLLNALVNTACGRELGLDPPRRRRRDGQVDPRRPGRRRRRDRPGRRADPARADAPTRAWASSATSTPAIRRRSTAAERGGVRIPMLDRSRVSGLVVHGAAQVLRPPEDGLPYLRDDRGRRAGRPSPAIVAIEADRIAAFDAGRERRRPGRRRPAAPLSRASSTATRTCRSRAGARRSTR